MRVLMKVYGFFGVDVDTDDPEEAQDEAIREFEDADFGPLFNIECEFFSWGDN